MTKKEELAEVLGLIDESIESLTERVEKMCDKLGCANTTKFEQSLGRMDVYKRDSSDVARTLTDNELIDAVQDDVPSPLCIEYTEELRARLDAQESEILTLRARLNNV